MTETLDTDSPWLVIIDMQTIFSQYPKWWGCPKFNDIIEPIRKLATVFGDRTLLTRFVAGADHESTKTIRLILNSAPACERIGLSSLGRSYQFLRCASVVVQSRELD